MKHKTLLFSALIAGVFLVAPSVAQADTYYMDNGTQCRETTMPVTVNVDGKYLPTDVEPYLYSGRTMVPMRAAGEAVGATVDWDQATQTATATLAGREVSFTLWDNTYLVDGEAKTTDVAPMMSGNRIFLPLRVFAEAFGVNVDWNQQRYDVTIDTPAQNEPDPYIPSHLDEKTATLIQKYYVEDDPADQFVGSYYGQYTIPGPSGSSSTDDFLFWSKCSDGTYQIVQLESTSYNVSYAPRSTRDIALTKYPDYELRAAQGEWKYEFYADATDVPAYYRGTVNRGFMNDGYFVYFIGDNSIMLDRYEYDFGGYTNPMAQIVYTKY